MSTKEKVKRGELTPAEGVAELLRRATGRGGPHLRDCIGSRTFVWLAKKMLKAGEE